MNCAVCKACQPHPQNPRRCIYGGPFHYMDATTDEGRKVYEAMAEQAKRESYPQRNPPPWADP